MVVKLVGEHNHGAEAGDLESQKIRRSIKRKVTETPDQTTSSILGEVLESASDTALVLLPRKAHLRRTVRAQRRKVLKFPPG